MTAYAQVMATRLNADADRVVRRATYEARRAQLFIKKRARDALRNGQAFAVRDRLIKLTPLLKETMLASHAVGTRRGELLHPQGSADSTTAMSLSVFGAAVKFLKRRARGDFDALAGAYEARAINVLTDAAEWVERGLRDALAEMTRQGVHVREGVGLLNDKFEALGLGKQRSHLMETIFRTNTQMAYGAGRWDADQDPAVQEILWGYEYTAVGDDRTRETHMAMDGTVLPKDDPFWRRNWPPNGWNCRCAAIPMFEEDRPRRPPQALRDGTPVDADRGFTFNAGELYRSAEATEFAFNSED